MLSPSCPCSLARGFLALLGGQLPRSRLAALLAAEPTQRNRRGVFRGLFGLTFSVTIAGRLIDDGLGQLVHVPLLA